MVDNAFYQLYVDLGRPSLVSLITLILSLCALFGKMGKRFDNRIKKIYTELVIPKIDDLIKSHKDETTAALEKMQEYINHRTDSKLKSALENLQLQIQSVDNNLYNQLEGAKENIKNELALILKFIDQIIAQIIANNKPQS